MLLHRVIAGAGVGDVVDHINGNTLDNRRTNLRVGSQADNMRNRRHEAGVGTSYDRQTGKWVAKHVWRGHQFFLGRFGSKEQATAAVLASVAEKRAAEVDTFIEARS